MSSSKRSRNSRFLIISGVAFALAMLGTSLGVPVITNYSHNRAAYLADLSAHNKIDPVIGYRAAMLLDGGGDSYRSELAERYIEAWKPQMALDTINEPHRTISASTEALLRSRALMELDRGVESLGLEAGGKDGLTQLLLVKATYSTKLAADSGLFTGDHDLASLVKRVKQGGLPLAQELQRHGMPQTSLRVLDGLGPTVQRELLIARIHLGRPNPDAADIQAAREAVDRGLQIETSNIMLHELSRDIYAKQENTAGVDKESSLLDRLHNGQF